MTTTQLSGVDLLRAAGGAAAQQGEYAVAQYLERAAQDHLRYGACPCTPDECAFEAAAARLLQGLR